jgi:multidrug resistance efflux pump
MKPFYFLCAALTAVLAGLTAYYRAEPDTFYGIADAKEIVVSSGSPVEIRRILVVQGQMVNQGDTLLELHDPELQLRISQISHELSELRSRKTAHATLSKSEIRQLKAQQEERVSEILAEIGELEAQYNLNRQLVSELRSLDGEKTGAAAGTDSQNPILIKLESLKKLLALVQDPTRVYESRLANALSSDGDPLAEQVNRLEDELRILNGDRDRLVITAQISGLIGSVDFKPGEKVSPFIPILTLHVASPSFVRGYIHEDVYSQVAVKQKVGVQSTHDRKNKVEGEVIGVGARIVEYPARLRKRAEVLIWGREIIIRIPGDNRFLLGEKVLISMPGKQGLPGPRKPPATSLQPAPAPAPKPPTAEASEIRESRVAAAGMAGTNGELPGIEASGLLHLPDIGRFLVISDDTEKKKPLVFLMDSSLKIVKTVSIRGLDKIDDMEAVSAGEDGSVYLLSSQSHTKGGKLPKHRKLLVKAKRAGEDLVLDAEMPLYDLLDKASAENADEPWAAFIRKAIDDRSMDIEGMAVHQGGLFLGFKAPLLDGMAVVLRIEDAAGLLSGKLPAKKAISIWKTLDLKDVRTGTACGVADLIFTGKDAWLLSTGTADDRHLGELWVLRDGSGKAERIKDFGGEKPEGLAWHAARKSLFIAFDNGSSRPSQILELGVRK